MDDIDRLLANAHHAMWLGMDGQAAVLLRRVAEKFDERATQRRNAAIDACAPGIDVEEIRDLPAFLRRQAE